MRYEIIISLFDVARESVSGTIDVESQEPHFFNQEIQEILKACAVAANPPLGA
jgi:putative methionine-R-sulfoxide reductase with GAF domain